MWKCKIIKNGIWNFRNLLLCCRFFVSRREFTGCIYEHKSHLTTYIEWELSCRRFFYGSAWNVSTHMHHTMCTYHIECMCCLSWSVFLRLWNVVDAYKGNPSRSHCNSIYISQTIAYYIAMGQFGCMCLLVWRDYSEMVAGCNSFGAL